MKSKLSKKSKIQKNLNSLKDHNEVPFKEGSFDPSYIYQAKMKQGYIRYAKIVELKLLKEDHDPNIPKTNNDYRYYMHFFGINRRMDDWVLAKDLVKTKYTIEELEQYRTKKKKFNEEKEDFLEKIEESEDEGLEKKEQEYHEEATKVKTISDIQIGKFIVDTWYFSPFPEGYHTYGRIYFCEFCLSFFVHQNELERHFFKCNLLHPPGNQIYEDPELKIAMFEVDGARREEYCENLSYLAKLFLDHKYIWYSICIFNFYILTEYDEHGYHFVGYFSKNKDHSDGNNLSCILVLPCHQKKGYGKFLINFSYELSFVEKRIGTPERPLSDLGKLAYMRYWAQRIIDYLQKLTDDQLQTMTIKQISENTSIKEQDIVDALEERKILKMVNGKIYMCLERNLLQTIYKQMGRPATKIHLDKLHWVPRIDKFETFN